MKSIGYVSSQSFAPSHLCTCFFQTGHGTSILCFSHQPGRKGVCGSMAYLMCWHGGATLNKTPESRMWEDLLRLWQNLRRTEDPSHFASINCSTWAHPSHTISHPPARSSTLPLCRPLLKNPDLHLALLHCRFVKLCSPI